MLIYNQCQKAYITSFALRFVEPKMLPDLTHSVQAARHLLGWQLVRTINGQKLAGMIVETEAYHQEDAASHSYRGRTPRVEVMFGPPGRAYVYFTYGMHYCMNVVTGPEGEGQAVLIRALAPSEGLDLMSSNRGGEKPEQELCNGPAKLCQALEINKNFNGHDLSREPLQLLPPAKKQDFAIVQTPRIGISRAIDQPWRFYISENPYVSRRLGYN